MQSQLYPLALIIPAFCCGVIAHYAWRRRGAPAATPFAVVMAAVAWWSLAYAFELSTANLHLQFICTCVEYVGIVTIPVAWLVFCLQYAGFGDLTTRPRVIALSVVPCLTLLMVWTNGLHGLFYQSMTPVDLGWLKTWTAVHGPFYWWNAAYSYALILTGIGLMHRTLLHSLRPYRAQSMLIIIAVLFPWGTNLAYLLGLTPVPGLDLTPGAFIITGAVLAWGLFRMRLLDVIPVAHDALFDALRDGVVVVDEEGLILDANVAARSVFGFSRSALLGQPIARLLPSWPELLAQNCDGEAPCPTLALGEGDNLRLYESRLFPLSGVDEARAGHLLFMRDITVSEAAERALRDTEVSYRDLFNTVGEAVYLQDAQGRFLDVNHGAELMYGYPREDFIGKTPEFLAAPGRNDLEQVNLQVQRAFAGEPQTFAFWGLRRNGEVFPKEVRLYKGRYLGQDALIALAVDLSERHRVEESQRLAAVGQLAAGVAHEFNNLLAAMLLRAEMVADTDCPEARELIDVVLRSARRGGETCSNLMAFANPRELRRAPVRIEVPLDDALLVARRQIENAQVIVVRHTSAPGACVYGDTGQLEQVFLNLIMNACHAMSEPQVAVGKRQLTIRTEIADCRASREVVVTVSDTGVGIAPEYLPRVFEPFFTTRAGTPDNDKTGTGLGLSVAHGIITAHGGHVEVSSTPGRGAAFKVFLPLHSTTAPDDAPEAASKPTRPVRPARVLLAEDEADVRRPVYDALVFDGHLVTQVETTEAALTALDSGEFEALITDLMLPGDGGEAILRHARTLTPRPVALAITGKLDPQLGEQLAAAGADLYLQKPFSLANLRQALGELLAKRPPLGS